jgi:hypothetical protein
MAKTTNILIGVGVIGLIGYYLYKNKSSVKIVSNTPSSKKIVTEEVVPVIPSTPANPSTPVIPVISETPIAPVDLIPVNTPIVPVVPAVMPEPKVNNPIIHPKTGKLVPPTPAAPETPAPIVIADMPPIIIDYSNIDPNIGSSLVNTNVVSTDPYANCKTQKEWDTIKIKGGFVPNDKCVIFEGSISGQTGGSFDMKTTKDTTLESSNASLNDLMTQGQDYTDYGNGGGMTPSKGGDYDPYGYGGIPSS